MTVETQTSRSFPYVGAPGWLTKVHQLCVRSMPQRMELDWLTAPDRLGLKQANARQLLSFMQKVGWVEDDGTVTEEGKKLRLVGEAWQEAMQEAVQRLYGDLVDQIKSATEFSPEDVESFFIAATEMGRSGRQQMIGCFRWFLREAGMTELEQKIWVSTRRTRQGRGQIAQRGTKAATPGGGRPAKGRTELAGKQRTPHQQDGPSTDPRLSTIASVLRINIDGTWEENRIKAVFRMLDSLLKGQEING